MTALDADALAAIRARAAAATPGPWECGGVRHERDGDHVSVFSDECDVYPPMGESGPVCATSESEYANAAFIAHARTDVPALLAHIDALHAAHAAAIAAARADALREAAASEASEIAAREAAMRGTLAAPSLATMRALHRAGGCWLVSYDDDDTGDPVVTIEYLDGARALAEKEGDNPVRWVAVDRCGRVCLPPQPDAIDALIGGAS